MEQQWRADRFKKAVAIIADQQNITKTELYRMIGEEICLSPRAVQAFASAKSRGPGADRAEKISNFLGGKIAFYDYDQEAKSLLDHLSGVDAPPVYSDFVKKTTLACLFHIRHYIFKSKLDEASRSALMYALAGFSPALPNNIKVMISDFVEKQIQTLTVDTDIDETKKEFELLAERLSPILAQ